MIKNKRVRSILSAVLTLCLLLSCIPSPVYAADADCTHHSSHTADCGYVEAVEGIPCVHICGEDCVEVCIHGEHDDFCGYVAAVEGQPCAYHCHICHVQELVDALPEATGENAEAIMARLDAIDETKLALTAEELTQVDFTRYNSAIAALNALSGQPGAEVPVPAMEIYVQAADDASKITIEVEPNETIEVIIEKIKAQNVEFTERHYLFFAGKKLDEGKTLSDYNIQQESTLYVMLKSEIVIEATENGIVTAVAYAAPDETVTLTVTPDEGYELGRLIVTDLADTTQNFTVNKGEDGTYTFTMPDADVQVTAVFTAKCSCTVMCAESSVNGDCAVCAAAPAACAVEENATAEITGVTLTVDGVTYTGAEGEGYAFINPNSNITVSITGVNLNNMTEDNAISGFLLWIDGSANWVINEDGTEASLVSPASDWEKEHWQLCSNINLTYTNDADNWQALVDTGIRPIYLNNAGTDLTTIYFNNANAWETITATFYTVGDVHDYEDNYQLGTAELSLVGGESVIYAASIPKNAAYVTFSNGTTTTGKIAIPMASTQNNCYNNGTWEHFHTPEADDGNCLTEQKCVLCDEIAVAAKESHTFDETGKCVCGVELGQIGSVTVSGWEQETINGGMAKLTEQGKAKAPVTGAAGSGDTPAGDLKKGSLSLFVNNGDTNSAYVADCEKWTCTDGKWQFAADGTDTEPLLWKGGNGEVEWLATYPYRGDKYAHLTSECGMAEVVYQDQTDAADWREFDILWDKNTTTDGSLGINFKHLYTKLRLDMTYGTEIPNGVEVVGMTIGGTYIVRDFSYATMAWGDYTTGEIVDINALGLTNATDGYQATYEALIIPQTAAPTITVELSDGSVYQTTLAEREWESGKAYVIDLQIGCSHEYSYSVNEDGTHTVTCQNDCGYEVTEGHTFGEDYKCTLCGADCPHESYIGGYCDACGKGQSFEVVWDRADCLTVDAPSHATYGQDYVANITVPENTHLDEFIIYYWNADNEEIQLNADQYTWENGILTIQLEVVPAAEIYIVCEHYVYVRFDGNGGTLRTEVDLPEEYYTGFAQDGSYWIQIHAAGLNETLFQGTYIVDVSRDGFRFLKKWKDAAGNVYDGDDNILLEQDTTFYAMWECDGEHSFDETTGKCANCDALEIRQIVVNNPFAGSWSDDPGYTGKQGWQDGDSLILATWYGFGQTINFENGAWTIPSDLQPSDFEGTSKHRLLYMPSHQVSYGSVVKKDGYSKGTVEYLEAEVSYRDGTLFVNFDAVRPYSRVRLVGEPNTQYSVNVDFQTAVPDDMSGKDGIYSTDADANGNLVLYGTFPQGYTLTIMDSTDTTKVLWSYTFPEALATNSSLVLCVGEHSTKQEANKATCTTPAVCDNCGESYGTPAPDAHILRYTASGNVITESCSVCLATFGTATITAQDTVYDGTARETATVAYSEGWKGGELTASYANNTNAGTATASITVGEATARVEFTIAKAPIVLGVGTVVYPVFATNLVYNGTAQALVTKTGSVEGGTIVYSLSLDGEYTTTIPVATEAGNYDVYWSIRGDENHYYEGTPDVKPMTIAKVDSSVTTAPAAKELTYNGETQKLVNAGTANGGTMVYSTTQNGTYGSIPEESDAGTYTVWYMVEGDSNHNDTAPQSVTVTIAPKTVDAPTFAGLEESYLHTGSAIEPTFKLMDGTTEIPESEYRFAYSANTEVGTATITITDKDGGNYTVSGSKTFEIVVHVHDWKYTSSGAVITAKCEGIIGSCPVANKTVTIKLTAPAELTYDGSAKTVTVTQSPAGVFTDVPAVIYEGNRTDAGQHTASLTYGEVKATLNFTIAPASLANAEISVASDIPYIGSAIKPEVTVKLGEKILTAEDYTVAYSSNTNVGEATVTITGKGNYKDSASTTFTIVKAAAPAIQWPTAGSLTYGQKLSESTLTSEDANGTFAWEDGEQIPTVTNNGCVVVYTPKDEYNYDYSGVALTKTISVTVSKVPASVATAPTAKTLTYTGEALALVTAGTAKGGKLVYSLTENGTYTETIPTGTNAGEYTVWYHVQGDDNHSDSAKASVKVIIAKAKLTVTSKNHTITYGNAPEYNGITYAGFVGNDAEEILYGELTYNCNYEQFDDVGSYVIQPAGLSADNYEIIYTPGTLTVEPKAIKVKASDQSKTYGKPDSELTYMTVGLVNDDKLTGALVRAEGENVGEYAITQGTLTAGKNYTVTFMGAVLTIEPKPITEEDVMMNGSLTYTGKEQTQLITVTEGITYEISGNTGTNVGTYELTVKGTGNYTGEVKLSWSIKAAAAAIETVPAANKLTYNAKDQALVTAGTAKGGKLVYSLAENGEYTETIPTGTNAGDYTVWYYVQGDANHADSAKASLKVTIAKAKVEISVVSTPITVTYGDAVSLPVATANFGTVSCDKTAAELVNAGTYTVIYTVAGTDNYEGDTKTVTVTIEKLVVAEPTVTETYIYTGSEQTVALAGVESCMTIASGNKATNAGSYEVVITLDNNHKWADGSDGKVQWSIGKAEFGDVYVSPSGILTYNGKAQTPKVRTDADSEGDQTATFTYRLTENESYGEMPAFTDAGTYTVYFKASAPNHKDATGSFTVTVDKAKAEITVDTNPIIATYGDTVVLPTATSNFGTVACDKSASDLVNAGTHTVTYTVAGTDNYDGDTKTVTVTINAKAITSDDVERNGSLTYNGKEQTQAITVADGITYAVSGDKATDAGNYELTVSGTGNYSGTITLDWEIAKAAVTITADDKVIYIGEDIPALTYKVSGLVDGDKLTENPTLTTSADGDQAGSYTITAANADAGNNYTINYVSGKLTIMDQETEVETRIQHTELTIVPDGLKDTEFNAVEKITNELISRILATASGYSAENMVHYDVTLQFSLDGGETWILATEENFPREGITVTLPYLKGTNAREYDFVVSHMFSVTSQRLGITAGDVEMPKVEETADGIRVTLNGLSPVTVAAKYHDHTGGTATCSDKAICTVCENAYGELDATNHAAGTEIRNAKAATCNAAGYTGDTWCKGCGEVLTEGTTIKATGNHTGGTATCDEKAICSVCGNPYGKLDAKNHTGGTEVKNAKDATCGATGYTGDTCCKGCGEVLTKGTAIKATGEHTYGNWKEVKEATKTAKGEKQRTCSVCGHVDSKEIPVLSDTPATGDDTNIFLWSMVMCISAVCLMGILASQKKRVFNR